MAFSKHHLYPQDAQIVSGFAKALGFPGRIEILLQLQAEGPISVQPLAKGHPISQETLSQHLKILREAQLVIAEERFPYTFYQVHESNLVKAKEAFAQFFNKLNLK